DVFDSGITYVDAYDPNGKKTRTGYDATSHVVRTVDALQNATSFTYVHALLKSITDANGNVTSYTYDVNQHLLSTSFPDGAIESLTTSTDGILLDTTDRRGFVTRYTRDAFDRISSGFYYQNANSQTTLGRL